jgi:hypothetical protein
MNCELEYICNGGRNLFPDDGSLFLGWWGLMMGDFLGAFANKQSTNLKFLASQSPGSIMPWRWN